MRKLSERKRIISHEEKRKLSGRKEYFSRRKEFLNMERVFFKKKVFEKKVILNLKYKKEGVFSV